MNSKLQTMVVIAIFAAIIGILAQVTIPLPLIPITGQTLAIGLAATILGARNGTLTTLLYILIGLIGIPVFAQMTAGFGVVFGPTGGFLIGFVPTAYIIGKYLSWTSYTVTQAVIANIIGMLVTLSFGTVWLKFIADMSWTQAFISGFVPFLAVGIVKAILAGWLGILVRRRLLTAKLIPAT